MPKTRKKRAKKKIEKIESEASKDTDTKEVTFNTNLDKESDVSKSELYLEDLSEPQLKEQLQAELSRLQDEYKRQKQITADLVSERDSIDTQIDTVYHQPNEPIQNQRVSSSQPIDDHRELYIESNFDQSFISDSGLENRMVDMVNGLRTELDALKERLESKLDKESLNELQADQVQYNKLYSMVNEFDINIQNMRKEMDKSDQKLSSILLELGFEESLNINKVPNYILVLVYERILNDLLTKIKHAIGPQDTEAALGRILENVRSHTSGGELFNIEHNKIKIPELRQYLDKKMISPKQIHITFNSIVEGLLEYTPGYSPKNFKAMIKIMSQEYAVDTIGNLEIKFDKLTNELTEIKNNLNKFMAKYKERESDQQFHQKELKNVNIHISNLTERFNKLPESIDARFEELLDEKLNARLTELSKTDLKEGITEKTKLEKPKGQPKSGKKDKKKAEEDEIEEKDSNSKELDSETTPESPMQNEPEPADELKVDESPLENQTKEDKSPEDTTIEEKTQVDTTNEKKIPEDIKDIGKGIENEEKVNVKIDSEKGDIPLFKSISLGDDGEIEELDIDVDNDTSVGENDGVTGIKSEPELEGKSKKGGKENKSE